MWQCLDLYVSLVCRLHREYFVAFFFLFFAGVVGCGFLFLSFYFVLFSFCSCLFLFPASFCLVCLFSVVC